MAIWTTKDVQTDKQTDKAMRFYIYNGGKGQLFFLKKPRSPVFWGAEHDADVILMIWK